MTISKWGDDKKYAEQSQIVKEALATPDHSLNELLRLMRENSQAAVYLSGSRIDSDYCFGSVDVGMLLSVLPEDTLKAAVPGFHPGSTEIYVTFQGTLVMECLENGQVVDKVLGQHGVLILPPGQCHRVRYNTETPAASVIVKTNLSYKPGVVRCDDCVYYSDKEACPLHQRWDREEAVRQGVASTAGFHAQHGASSGRLTPRA